MPRFQRLTERLRVVWAFTLRPVLRRTARLHGADGANTARRLRLRPRLATRLLAGRARDAFRRFRATAPLLLRLATGVPFRVPADLRLLREPAARCRWELVPERADFRYERLAALMLPPAAFTALCQGVNALLLLRRFTRRATRAALFALRRRLSGNGFRNNARMITSLFLFQTF